MTKNRAVFLDRDGVLNAPVFYEGPGEPDSPLRQEDFELLPGVAEAVKRINDLGWKAIVISNQPAMAKGKMSLEDLEKITEIMIQELGKSQARLDGVYYCLHHPEALREAYRTICECRKPKPGLLLKSAQEHAVDLAGSYMIGDSLKDMEAGKRAGCRTILIASSWGGNSFTQEDLKSYRQAENLKEAVRWIENREVLHADFHR